MINLSTKDQNFKGFENYVVKWLPSKCIRN